MTFRDITPLLGQPDALRGVLEAMGNQVRALGPVDAVVGVEARGFILGTPLALELGVGFVPVRKAGKLPADVVSTTYSLEYGQATIEMHADALAPGARVVVVDDVLATGGTLNAARELVETCGGQVVAHAVMIELPVLGGRAALGDDVPLLSIHAF